MAEGAVSSEPVSPRIWAIARRLLNLRPATFGPKIRSGVHRDGWIPDPGRPQRLPGGPTYQVDRAPRHRARRLAPRDACCRSWCSHEAHVPVVPENSGSKFWIDCGRLWAGLQGGVVSNVIVAAQRAGARVRQHGPQVQARSTCGRGRNSGLSGFPKDIWLDAMT